MPPLPPPRAREHGGVTDRGHRGVVLEVGIGKHGSPGQKALQSTRVLLAEARQVVVTELVYGNQKDELGIFGRRLLRGTFCGPHKDEKQAEKQHALLHGLSPLELCIPDEG